MTEYTNDSKNTSSFSNDSKNTSSYVNYVKHREYKISELENVTFDNVVLQDGRQFSNLTFDELIDIVYTNQSKN